MPYNRISYLKRKLKYFIAEKVKGFCFVYFLTLTSRDGSEKEIREDYSRFVNGLKKYYERRGVKFDYIAVFEMQRRGVLHVHMMIVLKGSDLYKPMREVSEIAKLWGRGYVYIVRVSGLENMYRYLSKYLSKEDGRVRGRLCNSSRMSYKAYLSKLERVFMFGGVDYVKENGVVLKLDKELHYFRYVYNGRMEVRYSLLDYSIVLKKYLDDEWFDDLGRVSYAILRGS